MHPSISSLFEGAALYGFLAYAAQTIPTPTNPWAKWLIGCIQYALSNVEKGQAALNNPPK